MYKPVFPNGLRALGFGLVVWSFLALSVETASAQPPWGAAAAL